MNKKVFGRKLSRSRPSREALFATLAKSLILNGKIVTTRAKAKAVQPDVEKFVTLAKKADIAGRRRVLASLDNAKEATDFLFQNVANAFKVKSSGFTRIVLLPNRKGDNAQMVRLEWTEKVEPKKEEIKEKKPKKAKEEKPVAKKETKKEGGKK